MTTTTWPIIRNTIRRGENDRWTAIWTAIDWLDQTGNMTASGPGHSGLIDAVDSLEETLEERCEATMSPEDSEACAAAEEAVVEAAGACAELVCTRLAGERLDDAGVVAAMRAIDWTGWWPVVDGDAQLTGEITDGAYGYLNVDDEAMISEDAARRAGWRIDAENRSASPSEPVTVEFAVANETIRLEGGIDEFAGLEHPAIAEACAAYRAAATDCLDGDRRACRLRADRPQGQRMLHSQWAGAHWEYSAGAIGTMASDLTEDEEAAIDAAHEAGLAAARTAIEYEDAARAAADAAGD